MAPCMLRKMVDAPVPGKRPRGRQHTRWKYYCNRDKESAGLKVGDPLDNTQWKRKYKTIPATPDDRKPREE